MSRNKYDCTVEWCNNKGPYKLYCTKHYQQMKNHGEILPEVGTCVVEECSRNVRSKHSTYCEMHYYRLRRNDTTEIVAPRVPDAECVVEGCRDRAYSSSGQCRNCYLRLQRNGDYDNHTVGELSFRWVPDDEVTYTVIHQRVKYRRGSASEYRCVQCGEQARQWAYDHGDPGERRGKKDGFDYVMPFSVDIWHYQPMCVPCHKRMDLEVSRNINEEDVACGG